MPFCVGDAQRRVPNFWLSSIRGTRLRPQTGDCYIFCSYGNHPCLSKQRETLAFPISHLTRWETNDAPTE